MSLELTAPAPDAPDVADDGVWLADIETGETYAPFDEIRYTGEDGNLLEVRYAEPPTFEDFQGQGRGVWRYRAALPFEEGVTLPEGDTPLHEAPRLREDVGVETLRIKHEGMNPTGSFKDRGMTVGVRVAKELGVGRLACASTGNTSAALAAYGARGGMETLVLLPPGRSPPERSHRRRSTTPESSKSTATSTPVSTSCRTSPSAARCTCSTR